jgi:predicted secreted Zn-dependent protease
MRNGMRMSHWVRIGLIAAAGLLAAGCTTSRITTTYYNISGVTGADLDREIARKGPLKGHALASTAIKFVPVAIRYDESGGKCRYSSARFRIEANVTLPRWRQHSSSDPELRSAWKYLANYAREHEDVHIAIAEKYAAKIADELEAIPAKKSCDSLDAAAEVVLKRNRHEHNREQLAFDAAEQKRLGKIFD